MSRERGMVGCLGATPGLAGMSRRAWCLFNLRLLGLFVRGSEDNVDWRTAVDRLHVVLEVYGGR